jgi:4'-phosphopantetheinyl transferase
MPPLTAQRSRIDVGGDFELWLCDLDAELVLHAQQSSLSADERRKAARFVFERDRRRYVSAHEHLRALLAERTGTDARQLAFAEGEFGKPFLPHKPDCAFNLSHSEGVAIVMISARGELGVDVEVLRPMRDALALAERNFSRSENADLRALPERSRDHAFLTGWTRKEACLKAIGSGLSISPDTFTAGLNHDAAWVTVPTPQGLARVRVVSFCHEERLLIACAELETPG